LPLVLLGLSDDVLFESFSSSTECWNFVSVDNWVQNSNRSQNKEFLSISISISYILNLC
jgi:hypothetical protein